MSVLIVDDNKEMVDLYETCIDVYKLDWKVFDNGAAAIRYLRENSDVEAVILDVMMPDLDGLTVSEEIRLNEDLKPPHPPVKLAYFTAFDKTPAVKRIMEEQHVEKYFAKPMEVTELVAEVENWLGHTQ